MKRILVVMLLTSCGHITGVDFKNNVGIEFRNKIEDNEKNIRTSYQPGLEVKTSKGYKAGMAYRYRMTDLGRAEQEHGMFFNFSIPLWRR